MAFLHLVVFYKHYSRLENLLGIINVSFMIVMMNYDSQKLV